jgi:hypothetical protein
MQIHLPRPTLPDWKKTDGEDYSKMFQAARSEAQAVDETKQDSDPRDNFVQLSDHADVPGAYVQLWGPDGSKASVIINRHSYEEKTVNGDGGPAELTTQKDRHIEMRSTANAGVVQVRDSLGQSVDRAYQSYTDDVWDSHDDRILLVELSSGETIGEGHAAVSLFEAHNGNLVEFRETLRDLG